MGLQKYNISGHQESQKRTCINETSNNRSCSFKHSRVHLYLETCSAFNIYHGFRYVLKLTKQIGLWVLLVNTAS
jgi:hypothetical protein